MGKGGGGPGVIRRGSDCEAGRASSNWRRDLLRKCMCVFWGWEGGYEGERQGVIGAGV